MNSSTKVTLRQDEGLLPGLSFFKPEFLETEEPGKVGV